MVVLSHNNIRAHRNFCKLKLVMIINHYKNKYYKI